MRKQTGIILTLVFALALFASACSQSVASISRGVFTASQIAEPELADAVAAGDLSEQDGARLGAYVHEVGSSARVLQLTASSWPGLPPAQKREAALRFISETASAQERLDAGGTPVFKSEKSRKRFAEFQKWLRRARIVLREVEFSLPKAEQ